MSVDHSNATCAAAVESPVAAPLFRHTLHLFPSIGTFGHILDFASAIVVSNSFPF